MSVTEVKNAIIEKVLSIDDKAQLDYFLILINLKQKDVLDKTMQNHLNKILFEDHNLLHRLAQ
ncbi:MAG: hypothetical protein V4722_07585 [Bacteroidota bacterium]